MRSNIILYLILIFLITSCGNKTENAKESLIGEWSVKEIFMSTTAPSFNLSLEDKSGIGQFVFTNETVDYEYSFGGDIKSNTYDYSLQVSKENAGFINIDRFDVIGEENYRVRFGDETSDAHENASSISLERVVNIDTMSTTYLFLLEKK